MKLRSGEVAKQLGIVFRACKVRGDSRESFSWAKELEKEGGDVAGPELSRQPQESCRPRGWRPSSALRWRN
jgi:hypothetical protein